MKNENKTETLKLRCTKAEKAFILNKARNYKSLSAYILHSCIQFDDRLSIMKLEYIDDWMKSYKQYKNDFNSLANNINQIAHYINTLHLAGIITDNFIAEDKLNRESLYHLLTSINEMNNKIESKFKDFAKIKINIK